MYGTTRSLSYTQMTMIHTTLAAVMAISGTFLCIALVWVRHHNAPVSHIKIAPDSATPSFKHL